MFDFCCMLTATANGARTRTVFVGGSEREGRASLTRLPRPDPELYFLHHGASQPIHKLLSQLTVPDAFDVFDVLQLAFPQDRQACESERKRINSIDPGRSGAIESPWPSPRSLTVEDVDFEGALAVGTPGAAGWGPAAK